MRTRRLLGRRVGADAGAAATRRRTGPRGRVRALDAANRETTADAVVRWRSSSQRMWPAAVILAAILTVPVLSHEAGPVLDRPASVESVAPDVHPSVRVSVVPTLPPSASPTRHPEPVHQLVPERTPQPTSHRTGRSVTGTATWFCGGGSPCTKGFGPSCLCAAAGPALRVGQWRGRIVSVRGPSGRTIQVQLSDWCFCGSGRVIDLYRVAFSQLADPSVGILKVTVSW